MRLRKTICLMLLAGMTLCACSKDVAEDTVTDAMGNTKKVDAGIEINEDTPYVNVHSISGGEDIPVYIECPYDDEKWEGGMGAFSDVYFHFNSLSPVKQQGHLSYTSYSATSMTFNTEEFRKTATHYGDVTSEEDYGGFHIIEYYEEKERTEYDGLKDENIWGTYRTWNIMVDITGDDDYLLKIVVWDDTGMKEAFGVTDEPWYDSVIENEDTLVHDLIDHIKVGTQN